MVRHSSKTVVKTTSWSVQNSRVWIGLCFGWATLLLASSLWAESHSTKTHGYSFFGELNYPADFAHLAYVNPNAPKGGEISIWGFGTFDSMNPYSRKGRAAALASAPFESLLEGTADEVGASYGLLAESLEYPEDVSWVRFHIRPEARFSDGSAVTAQDVKFTYDLFLEQGLVSFRAVLGEFVQTVEVLDSKTVQYTFLPDSPLRDRIPTVGGLPVMSQAWFKRTGARLDESRMEPAIGSGPYLLDRYEINRNVIYTRNPNYWGKDLPINRGRSNFDQIRVEYFADGNAAFEAFKAGAYTVRIENSSKTWATGYDFSALDDGHMVKKTLPDGGMATGQSFAMNLRKDKFSDPQVRAALSLLFNFEWSNESLFYGQYARINSFWENSDMAASGPPGVDELALLTPLVDQLPEGILTDDAVMAPKSGPRATDRKNLRAAGVDAIYNRIDPAQYTDRTRNFDFDIITDQFSMNLEPGAGLKQYFGSETADVSVFNSAGISSTGIDALIDHVTAASSKAELRTAVKALDRALRAYRFWIPQWYNATHRVAYWDMYEHPDIIAPYSLGYLDYWWYNEQKAAALKSAGVLR